MIHDYYSLILFLSLVNYLLYSVIAHILLSQEIKKTNLLSFTYEKNRKHIISLAIYRVKLISFLKYNFDKCLVVCVFRFHIENLLQKCIPFFYVLRNGRFE